MVKTFVILIHMRTTVTFEADVGAALAHLREERGWSTSEAVNRLLRHALIEKSPRTIYEHRTADLGINRSVDDVAHALDVLDLR